MVTSAVLYFLAGAWTLIAIAMLMFLPFSALLFHAATP
jgi:hypothetical protein